MKFPACGLIFRKNWRASQPMIHSTAMSLLFSIIFLKTPFHAAKRFVEQRKIS